MLQHHHARRSRRIASGLALGLAVALPALAAPPFTRPADCTLGEDCWVVRHVDRDPGPGVRDVGCGMLTGDAHRGTDIALADMARLADGVLVISPAAGEVVGVRDGMPDIAHGAPGAPRLDGRNCGNGVRIVHAEGWVSQLCHLRRGSLLVAAGDRVEAGDPVGRIGLSGETTFPHVHWSLWHEDRLIDPYDGAEPATDPACATGGTSLIAGAPAYAALPLVDAGFAPGAVEDDDILRGWHGETTLPATAPALVLWMHAYGTELGDVVRFRIDGPTGTVLDHENVVEDGHARGSYFAGTRRPDGGWPPGRYAGEVTWQRGEAVARRRVTVELRD